MQHLQNHLLRISMTWMVLLTFSACQQTRRNSVVQTQTPTQTRAITATFPVLSPTARLPATETPGPIPTNAPIIPELGQPFWIGRGKIQKAIFLPGAKKVAIAWGSGVSLNSVETGQELWFQETPSNLVAFDVQPEAAKFAASLADGSVMVFDAANGKVQRFENAESDVYGGNLAWSPDGRTVAYEFDSSSYSNPIYLLDAVNGQIGQVPHNLLSEGEIRELVWSPDGSAITGASLVDACPRFVDIRTGEERLRLGKPGECYYIPPLLFLPDGKTMVVQSRDSGVDLLSFPGATRTLALQRVAGMLIGPLFVDPKSQWLASRGGYQPCYCDSGTDQPNHPLVVWDLAHGVVLAQLRQTLEPLEGRYRLAATFDDESIWMLYESGEITRWRFQTPQSEEMVVARVSTRPISPYTLSWSADGSRLAFTGVYGGVDVYETTTRQLLRRFDPPLDSPALSPDGRFVALFDPSRKVEAIYQVQDGRLLQSLPASPVLMGPAFSPDVQYLAYGAGDKVMVIELTSGKVTPLDPAPEAPSAPDRVATRMIWAPDGQALVTAFGTENAGSDDPGEIVLWKRLVNGSFEAIYNVTNMRTNYDTQNLRLAAFNPSGNRIALQSMTESEASPMEVVVYDLAAGKVIQTLTDYRLGAWVNDETLLVVEGQLNTRLVHIHVITGEITVGRYRDLGDLAYAPGGLFVAQPAVFPPDQGVSIRFWQSGDVVAQAQYDRPYLLETSWSPDGRWLASTGTDGTLRVWRVGIW